MAETLGGEFLAHKGPGQLRVEKRASLFHLRLHELPGVVQHCIVDESRHDAAAQPLAVAHNRGCGLLAEVPDKVYSLVD